MKTKFILCLIFILTVWPGWAQQKQTHSDAELLRKQIISELMAPNVNDAAIRELITTLNPDGSWSDINYKDVSRIAFQNAKHLTNLISISHAYRKKGSPFKGKKELKNAIHRALDFWLKNDFVCENWWNNEIQTPGNLTAILLIMDEELTAAQIEKASVITGRANINAPGARQSGDRVIITGTQAKNALLKRDTVLFEMLTKVIEGELRFVPDNERGLQFDYSFHHRDDKVNNTLSYGLWYAETLVDWVCKFAGTHYRFSEASVHLLIDYYLDGICKMMVYGKYADPGATNREISRTSSGRVYGAATFIRLMNITDYRKEELQAIVKNRQSDKLDIRQHSTFFWLSDHYTHQGPNYFTSVRMFSTRDCNMEVAYNGEGLTNHHRGDGANYISVTGTEYFPISPVYDWQKIPGTTSLQQSALPPEGEIQKQGLTDFVGAVTDGQYGAVGFDFISPHSLVKARKAWFFFDTEYVCLGAGISSTSKQPVVTTLNQCKLNGEVIVQSEGKEQTLSKGEHPFSHANWLYHDGTGYIFPEPAQVVLSNQAQTGSWYSINRQVVSSRENIALDVFKLWIDHGSSTDNATYQYIVIPVTTKDATEAAATRPKVEIVANTPALQAVWHRDLKIFQAVFYKNGEAVMPNGLKINMEGPGIVMIKAEGKAIREIAVADPLHKLSKIRFSIDCKLTIDADNADAVWNDIKGISEIAVDLPQGIFAGKTAIVHLK